MFGFMLMMVLLVLAALGLAVALQRGGVLPRRDDLRGEGATREDLHRLQETLAALDARLDRLEDQQRFLEGLLEARPERPALPPVDSATGDEEPERGVDSVLFDVEKPEP